MTSAVLFYRLSNEREGIIPVNTFVYANHNDNRYLDEVTYHVNKLIQNFVVEELEELLFWLDDEKNFDPEEEEDYGYVYAELDMDSKISLPGTAYESAKKIVNVIVKSGNMYFDFSENGDFTLTGYTVEDIPETDPSIDVTVPVDPRYSVGDELVDSYGRKFTYLGVQYNPLLPKSTYSEVNYQKRTVKLPLNNNAYVKAVDIEKLLSENEVNVYPVPFRMSNIVDKKIKWFTRTAAYPKAEGYGQTQKEAKADLAFMILRAQKN